MQIEQIQAAIAELGLDGWLFFDFRGSDPLAYSVLGLKQGHRSRRWFYYVPATGHPTRIVHAIETGALDGLPGRLQVYLPWQQMHEHLKKTLQGARHVAMQYSPLNNIPYVGRVDAGTVELVRSFGVDVVSSADLVSRFEATLNDLQLRSHLTAAGLLDGLIQETFGEVARRLVTKTVSTEYDIQQYMVKRFEELGLEADHPPIVAVDAHSADPHYAPSANDSTVLRPQQFLLIDAWCKLKGSENVYADFTWTAYLGNAVPTQYHEIFEIVAAGRDAAVKYIADTLRDGQPLRGCDVDDVCRNEIRKAGYGDQFIHRTGHSLHRSVHGNGANLDNLESRDERLLAPRTLCTIEPGVYLPGQFGVRSEINLFITEKRQPHITSPTVQSGVLAIPCL